MNKNLMTLEAYLDGDLAGAEKIALEQTLAGDAQLRNSLRRLQSQRALRGAAMASFEPDAARVSALTHEVLEQCRDEQSAPIGRVGMVWVKRFSAVAAMLIIAAGAYYSGRGTVAAEPITRTVTQDHFVVQIVTSTGEATEHVFASKEEANDFVESVQRQQGSTQVAGIF